jgi:Fuc2NAc and GlcNAc transferase
MLSWQPILLVLLGFVLSIGLTRFLLSNRLLHADVPNDRSMHTKVIPRGAGVSVIVIATLLYVTALWLLPTVTNESYLVVLPMLCMALVGWLDDALNLTILPRFVVQICVALAVMLYLTPAAPELTLYQLLTILAGTLVLVWLTNLFNFMDGMDGLAASQAVMVFTTYAYWFFTAQADSTFLLSALLAATSLAFLVDNWSPAKVFMGDVGSLSIGMMIGVFAFVGYYFYEIPLLASLVLMMSFTFDATFTLLRRIIAGEKWWQSHRSHLYQRAATFMSHRTIVSLVIIVNLFFIIMANFHVETGLYGMQILLVAIALMSAIGTLIGWQERRQRRIGKL